MLFDDLAERAVTMLSRGVQLCFVLFHREPTLWTTSVQLVTEKLPTSSPHTHLVWPPQSQKGVVPS